MTTSPLRALWDPVRRIMVVCLLVDLAVSSMLLGVQYLAIGLHASPMVLGLLGTLGSLSYTVFCLISGSISDRYGRKRPAIASCLICAVVWVAMALSRSQYHLLALAPLSGAALALFWPSAQAWIGELSGSSSRRLNQNLSLFNIYWTIGIMSGPLVAGVALGHGLYLPFLIAATVAIAGAVVTWGIPPGNGSGDQQAPAVRVSVSPAVVHLFLLLAWLGNFASWYARGTIVTLYPRLGTDLGFAPWLVGFLMFVLGCSQLIVFALASRSERWHYNLPVMMVAETVGVAGMAAAAMAQAPGWFVVAFTAVGASAGVTYASSLTYALHGAAGSRGQRSGLHEAVLGMGGVLGPFVGGIVAQVLDLRAPLWAGAVVYGLAIVAQAAMWTRGRRAPSG